MNPGFLQHLAAGGLFVGFAFFHVPFREAPVGTAFVFDEQKAFFAADIAENHRAARTLIKTVYGNALAFMQKRYRRLNIVNDKPL